MKPPIHKAGRAFALLAGTLAISGPAGCFALGEGLEPPLTQFYYPTAVMTSPGQHALYVVNSDFDIQYTGGTVQALDLDGLRSCLLRLGGNLARGSSAENACSDAGLGLSTDGVLVPGPCAPIDIAAPIACTLTDDPATDAVEGPVVGPLIRTSVVIGAFAASAALVSNPAPADGDAAARMFVTVRGDPSVTYFDLDDDVKNPAGAFRLDCKADGPETQALGRRCGEASRIGANAYESSRLLTLPVEPLGIAASDDGRALVTVHETEASASLMVNRWNAKPTLEFTATGLPNAPNDVASIPSPAYLRVLAAGGSTVDYAPGFLATFSAAREVDLLRFYDDSAGTSRHFLQRVGAYTIFTNSDGTDSRGIAIDASVRRECEAKCAADDLACLRPCVALPLGVYIANRTPSSLLVGKLTTNLIEENGAVTGATEDVEMNDMIPLTTGPSRVEVGNVLDADGATSPRVFVVSFDSRYVVIYNPRERRVEAAVRTGRGPHALAFDIAPKSATDAGHALLYVAHFTDSYVGVVDLDTRNPRTYGSMFAAVGTPTPPKESN